MLQSTCMLHMRRFCLNKKSFKFVLNTLAQAVIASLTAKDSGRFLGPDGKDIDY